MIPCTTCQRHYRVDDDACPFCDKPSGAGRAMKSIGAAFTTLVLAACYGGDDLGKYDTSWDSGGTGDTSLTTGETPTDTSTNDTGVSDTGPSDTGTTDTGTSGTDDTSDTGTTTDTDSGTYGSGGDSGTTTTTTTTTDSGL